MKFLHKAIALIADYFHIQRGKGGDFHDEERRLLNTYYAEKPTKTPKRALKTGIIMMVDGRTMHGGLSDRLRGICSIYYWCKTHDIPFYIHFTYPFSLASYLPPNSYDWTIQEDEISYSQEQARPILLMLHLLPSKLHKRYLNSVLPLARVKQLHIYSNTNIFDKHYKECFNELFSPAAPLHEAITTQLQQLGDSPFIAMVLRFQQLLGDFKEGNYKVLPATEREELIQRCLHQVDLIHSQQAPNSLVLITSESTTFLQRAVAELPYVRIIQGEVVHMDYTLDASYNVYLKSFVDMLTLSHAQHIYLLRTGDMYKSGFAFRAAAINDVPYTYIDF